MKQRTTKTTIRFHQKLAGVSLASTTGNRKNVRPQPTSQQPQKEIPTSLVEPSAQATTEPDPIPAPDKREDYSHVLSVIQEIREHVAEVLASRSQNLAELQQLGIELGMTVASHIIKSKLESDDYDISPLISAAVEELSPSPEFQVSLHPRDLENLRANADSAIQEDLAQFSFETDPNLPRGSCFVSGNGYGLMSTVQARLHAIRETLLEGIEDARIERRGAVGKAGSLRRFPDRRKLA